MGSPDVTKENMFLLSLTENCFHLNVLFQTRPVLAVEEVEDKLQEDGEDWPSACGGGECVWRSSSERRACPFIATFIYVRTDSRVLSKNKKS